MELDQILFKKVFNYFGNWNGKSSKEALSRTIYLQDISSRLTLVARALTGENIDIFPAEKEGGWKGQTFYLPTSFSLLPTIEENLNFYIFRVVYLSIQWENALNWMDKSVPPSLELSRDKAQAIAPIVLLKMEEVYPPVIAFYHSITQHFTEEEQRPFWLYGKYMSNRDVFENGTGDAFDNNTTEKEAANPTTEIKSKAVRR